MSKFALLILLVLLSGCGDTPSRVDASSPSIKDIGFSTYAYIGVKEGEVSCPPHQTAISASCDCEPRLIQVQKIKNNSAICVCDSYVDVEVSVICAGIDY